MSILEDLDAITPRKLNLHEWLDSREPAERERFDAACRDTARISTDALLAIVRKHGGATTRNTLTEYRNRVATR